MSGITTTLTINMPVGEEDFEVEVEVQGAIWGEYSPATWDYYGGTKEEFPEAEVHSVVVIYDEAEEFGGFAEGTEITHLIEDMRDLEDEFLRAVEAENAAAW